MTRTIQQKTLEPIRCQMSESFKHHNLNNVNQSYHKNTNWNNNNNNKTGELRSKPKNSNYYFSDMLQILPHQNQIWCTTNRLQCCGCLLSTAKHQEWHHAREGFSHLDSLPCQHEQRRFDICWGDTPSCTNHLMLDAGIVVSPDEEVDWNIGLNLSVDIGPFQT